MSVPAIATYPGTVTPLRGLSEFTESERDVLFARDEERDEIARLVTSEGFRAGLLYGEPGVGKTSLLRAGLVPHLRDHGVIALICDDIFNPIRAFAQAVTSTTSLAPAENEQSITFLARVVSQALSGQMYLFIIDDVDTALATGDERIVGELGELFARVVTRSGGRARFLFCCAHESLHLFGQLERRTGSLFPPSSRYELRRFTVAAAALVLERTLALAAVTADTSLARAVAETLGQTGPILPADVQIAALALRELSLDTPDALKNIGGAVELERLWLTAAAASTGNERSALRLVAELAVGDGTTPYTASWAATRASIDMAFASEAMAQLEAKGVVHTLMVHGSSEPHYQLSHHILAPRIREIAAPARQSARRAFELLGSKAQEGRRLSLREWQALRREGLVPATPHERAVIARTKRFFSIVLACIAALPVLLLVIIYVSKSGSYYLDVARPSGEGVDRVVVRAGSPSLSSFNWMPASPGFGSIVADTGITRQMVTAKTWSKIRAHDMGGSLSRKAVLGVATSVLEPRINLLRDYASTGSDKTLDALRKVAQGPEEKVALLDSMRPIARGSDVESQLVQSSLSDASPAVQAAALSVAAAAAARQDGVYEGTLARALAAPDADQRRAAFAAVRRLGAKKSKRIFQAALGANPPPAARRELLSELVAEDKSPGAAASMLINRDISTKERREARSRLQRSFAARPMDSAKAAARLAAEAKAPPEDRVLALGMLSDMLKKKSYGEVREDIKTAMRAKPETVRAAALPLYARIAPDKAIDSLTLMLQDKRLSKPLRVALALAWGEVARVKSQRSVARAALLMQLKSSSSTVRAAAARAYGMVGGVTQTVLTKMVKNEGFEVSVGAGEGLANAALVGGNVHVSLGGILILWKRKGRERRAAVKIFARMATSKAGYVYSYLQTAASSKDDTGLHRVAVTGLCNGLAAGHRGSRRSLERAVRSRSTEVRARVIQCVVDHPNYPKTATRIALALARDNSDAIRLDVARVLARASTKAKSKTATSVKKALTRLMGDSRRDVRMVALRALASLGNAAPKAARKGLTSAFAGADEREKLALLDAARRMGTAGPIQLALADESAVVRIAGLDTALATKSDVVTVINTALTDADPGVRRAAIARLTSQKDKFEQEAIDKALALAIGDRDPSISDLALTTLARLGASDQVIKRLERAFTSRSERVRAQAATACKGLVDRDAKTAEKLLEPLLGDPSHDVRVAMLPSLASAYATTNSPETLAKMLRSSEKHAMRRLTATGAFVVLARTEAGRSAAVSALESVAKDGSALVAQSAKLGLGLIKARADGLAFLAQLVP